MNYLYPNNVRAFVGCRQMEGCYNENSDYILGTKGICTIGRGPMPRIVGEKNWTFQGTKNDMYQAEHDALFASIRQRQADQRRPTDGNQHHARHHGPHGGLHGPAGHLGSGDEFAGETRARQAGMEHEPSCCPMPFRASPSYLNGSGASLDGSSACPRWPRWIFRSRLLRSRSELPCLSRSIEQPGGIRVDTRDAVLKIVVPGQPMRAVSIPHEFAG